MYAKFLDEISFYSIFSDVFLIFGKKNSYKYINVVHYISRIKRLLMVRLLKVYMGIKKTHGYFTFKGIKKNEKMCDCLIADMKMR
jgi:hypothetical protein